MQSRFNTEKSDRIPFPKLADMHIHTQYAYCSDDDMLVDNILARQHESEIHTIGIAEHAPHLYLPADVYARADFIDDPSLILRYRNGPHSRMDEFLRRHLPYRSSRVKLGLEVEVDCHGQLTLLAEHQNQIDYMLGAVHYLPQSTSNDIDRGFMNASEQLIDNGISILAHPFRFYRRNNLPVPKALYKPLACMLASSHTAVELNFHTNSPDLNFFRECLEHNVKIALGSDAHALYEVGLSNSYYDFLNQLLPVSMWQKVLYFP